MNRQQMKRVSPYSVCALFLSFFAAQIAVADGQVAHVQDWLRRMAKAAHTLNYDGTFVYSYDNRMHAMRLIHSADSTGERERLVSLNGPAREVVRDHDLVTCILSDNRSVLVENTRPAKQFPPTFPVHIHALNAYYTFTAHGVERMAGQEAQKISIRPRDKYRYGYHLWVDRKTGLLLRTDLLNGEDQPVEQFMFTDIHYLDDVPDKLLEPGISGREFTWYEPQEPREDTRPEVRHWHVEQVPAGFSLDVYRTHRMASGKAPIVHMVYSDGMASVSVFVEKLSKETDTLLGSSRVGAINAFGRKLKGYYVTVVGEVPQATVMLMGQSIEHKP